MLSLTHFGSCSRHAVALLQWGFFDSLVQTLKGLDFIGGFISNPWESRPGIRVGLPIAPAPVAEDDRGHSCYRSEAMPCSMTAPF